MFSLIFPLPVSATACLRISGDSTTYPSCLFADSFPPAPRCAAPREAPVAEFMLLSAVPACSPTPPPCLHPRPEATPSAAGGDGSCRPSFLCSSRHASGAVSGAAGGLGAGSGWAPAPLASSSSSTGTRRSRSPAAERGRCAELRSTRIIIGGDVTCSAPPILGPVYVELRQDVLDAGCSCV